MGEGGGVSFVGAAILVQGLGESVEVCQMEEAPARPLKARHCGRAWLV